MSSARYTLSVESTQHPFSPKVHHMSQSKIQHFILVFDRHAGHMVQQLNFGTNASKAVEKYEELEQEHRENASMDIVLVGSDSIETVKVTHANYFDGSAKDVYADVLSIANG